MDFGRLDQTLRDSIADRSLDNEEKFELRELGAGLGSERVRYLRNRAFDMTRELMLGEPVHALDGLRWLEQVIKTLDVVAAPTVVSSAYFAPGDACLRKLRELCRGEVQALRVLQGHRNIPRLFDVLEGPDSLILVMELADGDMYSRIWQSGALLERKAREFFEQVCAQQPSLIQNPLRRATCTRRRCQPVRGR